VSPTLTNGWGTGAPGVENSKQETEQTVPIITKVLTKTINCTFTAKIVKGHDSKFFSRHFTSDQCPPPFQIRSGATAWEPITICNTLICSRLDTIKPACQTDGQLH